MYVYKQIMGCIIFQPTHVTEWPRRLYLHTTLSSRQGNPPRSLISTIGHQGGPFSVFLLSYRRITSPPPLVGEYMTVSCTRSIEIYSQFTGGRRRLIQQGDTLPPPSLLSRSSPPQPPRPLHTLPVLRPHTMLWGTFNRLHSTEQGLGDSGL